MQYRPPNVNEFSNKKHVGSVSDSLGRLSAASECMASVKKLDIIMMYLNWYCICREDIDTYGYWQQSCDSTTFSTRTINSFQC